MSDAPRTDSIDDDALREFAEKLERELDAMTQRAEEARKDYELADRCFRNCQRELAEARECLREAIRIEEMWSRMACLDEGPSLPRWRRVAGLEVKP